ncbi:MAG: alpha/beta hydrolase [Candidatus Eremiobacteraeota bacterium]|nr:alpha/beta hydrolase [Candidatus Eremiobacteraeota bacterium]
MSEEPQLLALEGGEIEFVYNRGRSAAAPIIVFLHEGLGTLRLWRDLPARLCESTPYGSLVYSRFGNGFSSELRSARTPSYMHDEALMVLPEILDRLEIERPLLLGHSDGGSIAAIFAGAFPARCSGLILEAPHAMVEQRSIDAIAAIGSRYRSDAELRARIGRHHRNGDSTFFGWNDIWLHPDFRNWNIEAYVARITAPILAIQGTEDEYGTLEQIDRLAAAAPREVDRVLLARCCHAPHRDRAEVFLALARAWIAERR